MDTAIPQSPPLGVLPPSPGPMCHGAGCRERPLVQWQRRLTAAELDVELAIERDRRSARYELRDVRKPAPVEGPMPTSDDFVHAVYACGTHAVTIDSAALVHEATCAGPNSATLPQCGCSPEATPEPVPGPVQELPVHWTTAAGSG